MGTDMRIDEIDTSEQARSFAEQIRSGGPRTFFLQGQWGSGKTEYLKKVESLMPGFRFIEVELWKPKDNASLAKKLFETTNPLVSRWFMWLGWAFSGLSVFASVFVSVRAISSESGAQLAVPLSVALVAVILTTLYGAVQSGWMDADRIRMWIASKTLTSKRNPKVLVIDDFDRLNEETQKELYKLFNTIHGSTRIIFVGDLRKLSGIEESFLGKIIDMKVALPFQLQPRNIAQRVRRKIADELGHGSDSDEIESLFAGEDRTARDANQFLSYVESEFIGQGKNGKVQTDQELFIIYLYLFHPDQYQTLVKGWLPKENPDKADSVSLLFSTSDSDDGNDDSGDAEARIARMMEYMFQPRTTNPVDFRKNSSVYFVNELAGNHSLIELKQYVEGEEQRRRSLLFEEPSYIQERKDLEFSAEKKRLATDYEELYDYINRMKDEEYQGVQEKMELDAVRVMHSETRHKPNRLIRLVFKRRERLIVQQLSHDRMKDPGNPYEGIVGEFDIIFNSEEERQPGTIPATERMYCYRACLDLRGTPYFKGPIYGRTIPAVNETEVRKYFSGDAEARETENDFGQKDYDAEALILQLGYEYWLDGPINPTQNPDFQSKVKSIEKLKQEEYKAFWETYDIQPAPNDGQTLQGGGILDFEYSGHPYRQNVLSRLTRGLRSDNQNAE